MNDEFRMTNDEAQGTVFRAADSLRSSFVIRRSPFSQ